MTNIRHVEYDDTPDHASTGDHLSVDDKIRDDQANPGTTTAFKEGFAASSGIRPEAAESGGRLDSEEMNDDPRTTRAPDTAEKENAGLADS